MALLPIVTLVLTATIAQALPPPRDGDIRALYWELRNESEIWVTLEPMSPTGKRAPQGMTLTFTRRFAGKWPDNQPARFEIRADAGLLWAPKNELWIAVDGERIDFASHNPYGLTSGAVSTYVAAEISLSTLVRIAKASRVSGNALGFDFVLTQSQRQAVQDFLERAMSDNPMRLPRAAPGGMPASQSPQPARLTLNSCTVAATPARCGSLRVPEDHAAPMGRQLTLKVRILERTGPNPGQEPLFVLAGGPGQAVTDHLEYFVGLFSQVRRNRDIVLVDQRGTSGTHALNCAVAERSFVVPADLAQCLSRLSGKADLKSYGTDSFVQDLDLARDSLKYEQISLYGASYGTRAAYAYARRYPARVHSLVLVSPATLSMPVLESLEQDGDRALDAVVDDCLAEPRCAGAFPRLRDNLASVRTSFDDPFYALGLRFLLYSSASSRAVPYLITEAAAGRRTPLDTAIDSFRTELRDQLSLGLHLTIMCGEDLSFREPDTAPAASAVRRDYVRVCREWPGAAVAPDFYDEVKVDKPALVIVGEWDPVTSPRWARMVASQFSRNQLVVLSKTGHIFTNADACLGGMTAAFLDQGKADASCASRVERPPYVVGSRE